jgi:hypothetical protein
MAYFENFISNEVLQWMQSGEALVAGSHRLTLAGSLSDNDLIMIMIIN